LLLLVVVAVVKGTTTMAVRAVVVQGATEQHLVLP